MLELPQIASFLFLLQYLKEEVSEKLRFCMQILAEGC